MKRGVLILSMAAGLFGLGLSLRADAHDEPVVGVLAGAGIGALIGNAPGAVVGAIVGAIGGATIAHENDHGRHAYAAHRVTYIEAPPASAYACEPKRAYYRPKVVYRETYSTTKRVAARPKMVKVCRYEPVHRTTTASARTRAAG
jgi:hypothetical protein